MVQFEARSDGEEFDVRLHGRWRSLFVCMGRLTARGPTHRSAPTSALTGLLLAIGELGRAASWW